jgi:hypothetical protein
MTRPSAEGIASADSRLTLTLDGLIPSSGGRKALSFPLVRKGQAWLAGAGSGLNRAHHRVEAKDLSLDGGKLAGRLVIAIAPDPWLPADGKTIRGEVSIRGQVKDGAVRGDYEGSMDGAGVRGTLSGRMEEARAADLADSRLTITIPDVWDLPGDRQLRWVVLTVDVAKGQPVRGRYGPFCWSDRWMWERYEPEPCDVSGLKIGPDAVRGKVRVRQGDDQQRDYELSLDLFRMGDQLGGDCLVSPVTDAQSSPAAGRTVKGAISPPSPTPEATEEIKRIDGKLFLADVENRKTDTGAEIPPDRYKLWLADEVKACRAVIVFIGHAEGRLFWNRRWRAEAARMRCGLAMCYPGGGKPMGDNAAWVRDGRAGRALPAALDRFGRMAKHPELHFAPWIVWGISWSGCNAYQLAFQHPQRTVACLVYHAAWPLREGIAGPPSIFVENSKESFGFIVSTG